MGRKKKVETQDNDMAQVAATEVETWEAEGGAAQKEIIIPVREEMGVPVLMEPLKDPVLIENIPVQEDVVILPPKISTKMPTRPAGEFVKLKDKAPAPVVDMKAELVEKSASKKATLTIPTAAKSGPNYARRNIELIKDVNRVMEQIPGKDIAGNPANRESHGVYKLSSTKRINNAGATINTGAQFQNKQDY